MTWRIEGCRRCGGDTFLDKDLNDVWFESCLQCGYDAVLKKFDSKTAGIQTHRKVRCQTTNPVMTGSW